MDGNKAGSINVAWTARNPDRKVAVCGMYWAERTSATVRSVARQILQQMRFGIGKTAINLNAAQFSKVASIEDARRSSAACRTSGAAWKKSYDPKTLVAPLKSGGTVFY